MAIQGCHSCGVDLSQYTNYEESPCATCKLTKEHNKTHRPELFDSAVDVSTAEDQDRLEVQEDNDTLLLLKRLGCGTEDKDKALHLLMEVIQNQVYITASNIIIKMLKLAKTSPIMFEVVVKKMQFPYMSYSEIGDSMSPPCSKQNVLYHLKHAVELFPDLSTALLTDTRFSAGRYALQTVANRYRQLQGKRKIHGLIYSNDPDMRAHAMSELNSILYAPFMVSDAIVDFDLYTKDEEKYERPAKAEHQS